jgi:hypothetical protein
MGNDFSLPPENFSVEKYTDSLTITWQWKNSLARLYFIFGAVWMGISFVIFFLAGMGPVILFLVFMWAIGLWIFYYALAQKYNSTKITATVEGLEIKIGPIPFPGNIKVSREEISQFYFVKTKRNGNKGLYTVYTFKVKKPDGQSEVLIVDLAEPARGMFIQEQLRKFYRLEGISVAGEYKEEE